MDWVARVWFPAWATWFSVQHHCVQVSVVKMAEAWSCMHAHLVLLYTLNSEITVPMLLLLPLCCDNCSVCYACHASRQYWSTIFIMEEYVIAFTISCWNFVYLEIGMLRILVCTIQWQRLHIATVWQIKNFNVTSCPRVFLYKLISLHYFVNFF
jgi:hypothetical protein